MNRFLQSWLSFRKPPLAALGSLRQVLRLVVLVFRQFAPHADRLVALDAEKSQGFLVQPVDGADGGIHTFSCSFQFHLGYVKIGLKLADSTRRHKGALPAGRTGKERSVDPSKPLQAGKAESVEARKQLRILEDFQADGTRQVLLLTCPSSAA